MLKPHHHTLQVALFRCKLFFSTSSVCVPHCCVVVAVVVDCRDKLLPLRSRSYFCTSLISCVATGPRTAFLLLDQVQLVLHTIVQHMHDGQDHAHHMQQLSSSFVAACAHGHAIPLAAGSGMVSSTASHLSAATTSLSVAHHLLHYCSSTVIAQQYRTVKQAVFLIPHSTPPKYIWYSVSCGLHCYSPCFFEHLLLLHRPLCLLHSILLLPAIVFFSHLYVLEHPSGPFLCFKQHFLSKFVPLTRPYICTHDTLSYLGMHMHTYTCIQMCMHTKHTS